MRLVLLCLSLLATTVQGGEASAYSCNHRYYVNRSGHIVRSPSCGVRGEGTPHAICRDGSTSYWEHYRGACSHHEGVASWR
jgi:hypothetical protein